MNRIKALAYFSSCTLFLCSGAAYGYSDVAGTLSPIFFAGGAIIGSLIGAIVGAIKNDVKGGVSGFLAGGFSGGVLTVILVFFFEHLINGESPFASGFPEYSAELALFTVVAGGIMGGFSGGLVTAILFKKNVAPRPDGE